MYLNKAIVIGNLTRDPERRSLPSGATVTSFGLATTRVWKDKNGVRQEDTQYHNIVVFGPQADIVAQYLRKGSSALVEGRMQTRSWDTADGQKKYRTEIVADRVQFGPRRESATSVEPSERTETPAASQNEGIDYPTEDINPNDIPF